MRAVRVSPSDKPIPYRPASEILKDGGGRVWNSDVNASPTSIVTDISGESTMTDKPDTYTVRLAIVTEIKATAPDGILPELGALLDILPDGTEVASFSVSKKGSYA